MMLQKAQLTADLNLSRTIGDFIQAYEEIYVVRMQRVRKSVLKTRHYMQGLQQVYRELRQAYSQRPNPKRHQLNSRGATKKPLVTVLLTTSQKLSGEINQQIFGQFKLFLKDHRESEILVVGSVGKELLDSSDLDIAYQYFDIGEDKLAIEQLKPILEALLEYQRVQVFHGKYINLVEQEVVTLDMGSQSQTTDILPASSRAFLFEPSLEALLHYFETQIFASLYKQTAHESYLAQLGSRITALEQATQHITERMKVLEYQKLKLRKQTRNRKQLMQFAGISLWHH